MSAYTPVLCIILIKIAGIKSKNIFKVQKKYHLFRYAINFHFHVSIILKSRNMRLRHIHSLIKLFRLLLWRILDAIDRKLGPGPGDHRL